MAEHILERQVEIDAPIEEVFAFFSDAGNLELITPPELNFQIITPQPINFEKGTLIDYRLKLRGIPITWRTEISSWDPPFGFVDRSLKGPYKQWIHRHTFKKTKNGRTQIYDEVRYRLPFEPLGDLALWFVKRELEYIFDYRQKTVSEILIQSEPPAVAGGDVE